MLDTSFIRGQVAFIFVLLLGSANLVSTNGDSDSPNKQVVDYNLQISELGEQFNQTIEVDTEKQTVLFKVPAHNKVDHSNILHDFKMNLSMLLLPEEKICYLLPLEKELLAPRKLLNDLDNAKKAISKTKTIHNKWTVKSEMTDRSVLSDELAKFCAEYPIYYVENNGDSLTTTRIQTGGKKTRTRRLVSIDFKSIPSNTLCDGATNRPTMDDIIQCVVQQDKELKVTCQIESETCYYIDVCETVDNCFQKHVMNSIICCKYVCI